MDSELMKSVEEEMRGRKNMRNLKSETDFLVGAMVMYKALNDKQLFDENEGGWMPPRWVLTIMRGDSVLDIKD